MTTEPTPKTKATIIPPPLFPFKEQTFKCECGMPSHHFFVSFDPLEDEVAVEIKLNHYLPWYTRLWVAFLYVIGREYNGQEYDTILLKKTDRKILSKLLLSKAAPPKAVE